MSRKCQITGKKPQAGCHVSHAHNKTKRRFLPNIVKKRLWVPTLKRYITLKLSTSALRTIDKKGIEAVLGELRKTGEIKDTPKRKKNKKVVKDVKEDTAHG